MSRLYSFGAVAAVAVLAGCAVQQSAPQQIQTNLGPVVCQLYQPDIVLLDEAISFPTGMGIDVADTICRMEGARQLDAYHSNRPYTPGVYTF